MTFGIFTLMMMTLLAFRKFSIICRKCDDFWHFFADAGDSFGIWMFCKFSMICQKWDDFWHFYIDADDSFGIWLCKFSMIWLLAFYADDSFGILMFLQICQKSWAQLWWRCKLSRRCQSLFWESTTEVSAVKVLPELKVKKKSEKLTIIAISSTIIVGISRSVNISHFMKNNQACNSYSKDA